MARYEITGTATNIWSCGVVQQALRDAGAMAVSKRRAFGMANQPYVATFCAYDLDEARRIADKAREAIPGIATRGSLPGLYPREYT